MQNTCEYRAYLDKETRADTWKQIILARQMYNDIVAKMREIHQAMQDYTVLQAGEQAAVIISRIESLTEGTHIKPHDEDWQMLECADCGAQTDRKDNGASILYQSTVRGIESRTEEFHQSEIDDENKRLIAKAEKLKKMQEGRRAKRETLAMAETA